MVINYKYFKVVIKYDICPKCGNKGSWQGSFYESKTGLIKFYGVQVQHNKNMKPRACWLGKGGKCS